MLGMTDPDHFEGSKDVGVDIEVMGHGVGKHHIEEVFHVAILLAGVDIRQALGSAVGIRCQSRHLGNQLDGNFLPVLSAEQIIFLASKG